MYLCTDWRKGSSPIFELVQLKMDRLGKKHLLGALLRYTFIFWLHGLEHPQADHVVMQDLGHIHSTPRLLLTMVYI